MENNRPKYAFLMIDYEMPEIIKDLHNKIKKDELYIQDNDYGLEKETHVTLVACLDNDVKYEELKPYLSNLSDYKVILTDISVFECDDYDVLKCSAQSYKLYETNEKICDKFDTHSEHKEYKPHVTIAYLKSGMAHKYAKEILSPLVVLKPTAFHYSWWEGDENKSKTFKI